VIESRTSRSFRAAFAKLPKEMQDQARRAYRLFRADPSHPSLRFKKVSGEEDTYPVRIGLGYRGWPTLCAFAFRKGWELLLSGTLLPPDYVPKLAVECKTQKKLSSCEDK